MIFLLLIYTFLFIYIYVIALATDVFLQVNSQNNYPASSVRYGFERKEKIKKKLLKSLAEKP